MPGIGRRPAPPVPVTARTWWRVAQAVAGLLVLYFVVRQFASNWDEIRSTRIEWSIRTLPLVASALVTWLMYAVLILSWRRFLLEWSQSIPVATAARIWAVSSLGKYIPGKVWAIAGMAVMAQRAGVAPWVATASALLMQALAVGTGVVVVAIAGTAGLELRYPWIEAALWGLAAASAIGVLLLVVPAFWSPLMRRLSPTPVRAARATAVTLGIGANLLAWAGYGFAFWLLAHGTLPVVDLSIRASIGAFTASYLAGLLALLMPGGLVVREGFLVLMLQSSIGLVPATALAVASRLMLTLTELGIAIPFLIFPGEKTRVTT
jgi:hypothetical protein